VPATAEGTLGLCIYDFGFKRETQEDTSVKTLTSGIKVSLNEPPSKKYKVEEKNKPVLQVGSSKLLKPV
jgi:hypothetical protein